MGKPEIIAGLDVGSAQVVCVVGQRDPVTQAIEILGGGRRACKGVKAGVVINIAETASAISRVLEETEEKVSMSGAVHNVYIGIRGSHIQTFNHHGALNIARTDKEITVEDRDHVIENTKAVPISADREIVHVIPQDFILDRQNGVPDPIGMEAGLLEVDVHIVTASSNHLNNIWKAVANAGFEVEEPLYALLAVGDLVVTAEEKDLGCLLIDMGGQSTSMAIYTEGSIRFTKELPIGADAITHDLAHALRTSILQAQQTKERYGAASREFAQGDVDEEIEYIGVDGRTPKTIRRHLLFDYIAPRVEEIFMLIQEELQNSNYAEQVSAGGVVLTGGGSLLTGLSAAAEQILELPVRLGVPHDVHGPADIVAHPSYATAVGLLHYRHTGDWSRSHRSAKKTGAWQKVRSYFGDMF
ncbi:MAG TPA: cell division protein FtsA [Elusimicrobiota bacterium]|nr:cell division protein FtsA [Elusimicrobiota bacterium]